MIERASKFAALAALGSLGLGLTCDAQADTSGVRQHRTNAQIKACIAELGKYADYSDAARVVHKVDKLHQRNLVELEIRVTSSVYLKGDAIAARDYRTSCVTDSLGDVVRLRMQPSAAEPDRRA